MTSKIVRDLRHEALDNSEFSSHLERTVERLEQGAQHPAADVPMIHRKAGWKPPAAYCKTCGPGHTWHGAPCQQDGCPCDTSCTNLNTPNT